jgi:glc operon protein GlcG
MKPCLEAADAAQMLAAAKAEAERQGWKVTIAIVDDGGALLALMRMDGAPVQSPIVATEKARSAALFRRPSKTDQDMVKVRPEMARLPGALPIQGGIPVMVQGECVGGIGVSGAQSHEDEQVALAGAGVVK